MKNLVYWLKTLAKHLNEAKEQKDRFLSILLGTLGASLSANLLATVKGTIRASDSTITAGQDFNPTSSFNKFWNAKVLSKRT